MNMSPQRQMILLAVAAAAVVLCFVVFGYVQDSFAAPPASPSPSASASAPAADEDEQPDPDATESSGPQTFHGHNCSPDCTDMQNGYAYGQSNDVQSPAGCATDQPSSQFREGCQIYVDEQASGQSP